MSFSTQPSNLNPELTGEQKDAITAQSDFMSGTMTPQNMYSNYSNAVFGGQGANQPDFGQTGQSALGQGLAGLGQSGLGGSAGPIAPQTGGSSNAHLKDYAPLINELQGYVQNMQQLIGQINSKF